MFRLATFGVCLIVLLQSSLFASDLGNVPIRACASFELFPDNTEFGSSFALAGYIFRELGAGSSLFVNESGNGKGLQFPPDGVEVTLPVVVSSVEFKAAAFAGPVFATAVDSAGKPLRQVTVTRGEFQQFRVSAPGIAALKFTEGGNEGIVSEICVVVACCNESLPVNVSKDKYGAELRADRDKPNTCSSPAPKIPQSGEDTVFERVYFTGSDCFDLHAGQFAVVRFDWPGALVFKAEAAHLGSDDCFTYWEATLHGMKLQYAFTIQPERSFEGHEIWSRQPHPNDPSDWSDWRREEQDVIMAKLHQ